MSGGGFSELFIRRAVATTLVMLAITMFGVFAYKYPPCQRSAERRLPHPRGQAPAFPARIRRPWHPPSPRRSSASSPRSKVSIR